MNESDLQTVTQRSSSRGQGSWLRWFAGGGVAAVLVIAMSSGCRPKVESPANKTVDAAGRSNLAPISVRTTNATERSMPRYLRVTGQLQGIQDAQVAADTAGKVIEAPVERGSLVKQGDILVKVDGRTAELSLNEAEASVALAQAKLALAKNEAERNAPLVKTKAIAEADFRKLEADQAAREADLAAAVARRDLARKTLSDSVIRAPFAGLVVERFVQPGEYVKADTRIARVVEVARLRLLLNVPETAVGSVREGQPVEFTTAAYPAETFTGVIKFLGGAVREAARDLIVEAEVQNADGRLKPGFFAEARVRLSETSVVTIPGETLRAEGSRRSVFLVENDVLAERLVEVGETLDGWVEVRRGVKAGEAVVLAPGREMADGVPAKVRQP
jgi:membrane fusion protein, multidrug efflux system